MENEKLDEKGPSGTLPNKETDFLIEQYRVLAYDRISHNQLFWNVQLMFLTAQSFLLILATGGFHTSYLGRAIGGLVCALFGIQSIQGFERNRMMEIADADILLDIERYFIKKGYQGLAIHNRPNLRKYLSGDYIGQVLCSHRTIGYLTRGISYELWKCGLWLITLISFVLFLYSIFVFCFLGSTGGFFFSASFADFMTSLDHAALGYVIVLFATNWILYVIYLIQKQQPQKPSLKHTEKQGEGNRHRNHIKLGKKKKQKTEEEIRKTHRIIVYCLEALSMLTAFIYTIFAYCGKADFIPHMWLILFLICLLVSLIMHWKTFCGIYNSVRDLNNRPKLEDWIEKGDQ